MMNDMTLYLGAYAEIRIGNVFVRMLLHVLQMLRLDNVRVNSDQANTWQSDVEKYLSPIITSSYKTKNAIKVVV